MASKKPSAPSAVSQKTADDFSMIRGIGPVLASRLYEAGLTNYRQLSSLTPAELAFKVEGLSAKQIAGQNWISQARKLSSKKTPSRPLKKEAVKRELRQHYENFTLEFLLDEKYAVRRTRLVHIQSGDADTWAGWEVESFIDFLARHAGVRLPAVKKMNEVGSSESSLISQIPTVDADTKGVDIQPPLTVPIVEPTLPQTAKEPATSVLQATEINRFTGILCLRNVEVITTGSNTPVSFLQQDQPYAVRLQLDLAEVDAPDDIPLDFKATILAKQLGGPSHAVGEIVSTLKFSEIITLDIDGTHLPPGAYRPEAFVELRLEESSTRLTANLKGNLLQVY